MLRRDYFLRMIEEFVQMLARIDSLKKGQLWREADGVLDEEFKRLVGSGVLAVSQMSETELLALVIQGGPTQTVHVKLRFLSTLLYQAGEVAQAQNRFEESRACYLKGLNLLLETLARSEVSDFPDVVPKVEAFMAALRDSALPLGTQAHLMQHYEQIGAFGKAEDSLFAMLETEPNNPQLLDFGIEFYKRLESQSDASLSAGNLPRTELITGLAELQSRK